MSQGHCPIRDNQFDKPLPPELLTLGSVLQKAGYDTIAVGKWGLGGAANSGWPAHPMRRGFDDFFGFMLHVTGHVYYHDAAHPLMDGLDDVGDKYDNIYSTDLFTARAKKFIVDHQSAHPDRPFFMYLAYTAVHNALQVPGGPYPSGGGEKGGVQWPLAPTLATRDTYIYPEYASQPWTMPMKRYATMARRLDDGVGDVLQLLKDLHIADNTLIVFTSDNGPANEGGSDPRLFDSWGPFDGFKRDIFEGGVREPTMVVWPGHIPAGRIDDTPTDFWDWMPTLAELSGVAPPAQSDGISILPILLHQAVKRTHPYIYIEYFFRGGNPASKDVFARKHTTGRGQQQLVRIGDFVGVRPQIKTPADPLRLYNVMTDPHEDHNLAADASHATLLAQMTDLLVTARRPDADAPRPYDDVPLPAISREAAGHLNSGKLERSIYDGAWPWMPDFASLTPASSAQSDGLVLPDHPAGPFGVQYTGYLNVPTDGSYTFTLASDTGAHLWLHDAHLVDSEVSTIEHPASATVLLRAGLHPIRLSYRHENGSPILKLNWSGPGLADAPIPPEAFFAAERQ